jgi:hypothetical protein
VVDLILQRHRDGGLINARNPGVAQGLANSIALGQVELGKAMKEVLSKVGEMTGIVELLHGYEFSAVRFGIVNLWVVEGVLASVEEHVHDDASCEDVHAPGVGLLRH